MKQIPSANKNIPPLVKIGDAARALGVSVKTLRRWEESGKISSLRTPGGTRLYSLESLDHPTAKAQYLSLKDASEKLGVSERTVRRWVEAGKLPSFQTASGQTTFSERSINNLLQTVTEDINFDSTQELLDKTKDAPHFSEDIELPQIPNYSSSDPIVVSSVKKPFINKSLFLTGTLFSTFILSLLVIGTTFLNFKEVIVPTSKQVLAALTGPTFLEINSDTQINGALAVTGSINNLVLEATPSANTFELISGDTVLSITSDIALDQDLSTISSPSFAGLTNSGASTLTGTVSLGNVLNYGNLSSDPTSTVNGATYYNTSTNKFRCYINGGWVNCDTDTDTTNSGDITGVSVGNGLSGGGSSGDVTVSLDVTTTSTTTTTSANSGLELTSAGLSLLRGCSGNQTLLWDSTDAAWECAGIGADSITADSLDFTQFKDSLTLDATTDIATAGFNLTTSGTGTVSFGNSGGISLASGVSIIPAVSGGSDLGSSSFKFNNLWVNNINTTTSASFAGQTIFTYQPASTAITESSVWINPTTTSANVSLLGLSVGGVEKARINSNGYLGLGGANDPAGTYLINAGSAFNVGTTGNVGITSTATTGTSLNVSASSITTGSALSITGPTSTGVISGASSGFVNITSDVGIEGDTGSLLYLAPDFSSVGDGGTGYGIKIAATDSSVGINTNYGIYSSLDMSGSTARKDGTGIFSSVDTSSTHGLTNIYGIRANTSDAGSIGSNYGIYAVANSTGTTPVGELAGAYIKTVQAGNVQSGNLINYGVYSNPQTSGPSTGSTATTNVYGFYSQIYAQHNADAGTVNGYGLYVANGNMSTNGTSTHYGIYVEAQTGADTNYAAIFAGGNVGIGDTSPSAPLEVGNGTDSLQVSSVGDITFVDADGAASITGPAGGALTITGANSQALNLTTTTAGNISLDPAGTGDITFTLDTDGSVFTITDTANTTNTTAAISATAITTGSALSITGPTATGVTSGASSGFVNIASDVGSAGTEGSLLYLAPDFSASAATNGSAIRIIATDSTTTDNSDYGIWSTLTLTGNAAKAGYGILTSVTNNSTSVDGSIYGGYFSTSQTANATTGVNNGVFGLASSSSTIVDHLVGVRGATAKTGNVQSGTQNNYGIYSAPSTTGPSTGTTAVTNVYGLYSTITATHAADAGTVNGYGVYVADGTSSTNGTSTKTGLYVESPTGADNNYAAIFAGGNVGIGTTDPTPTNLDTTTPLLVVAGSGVAGNAQIIRHTSVGAGGALLNLSATRGTDADSHTILQSDDGVGTLSFKGSDGAQYLVAASIAAQVDGTPGVNDLPGRLIFGTTADGGTNVTERMRIDSLGSVGIGGSGNVDTQLQLTGTWTSATSIARSIDVLTTLNAAASQNAYGIRVRPTLVEAGSGTHSFFAGVAIEGPTITDGGVTTTNAASLYIPSSPTGATNNYSVYSAGTAQSYFAGNVGIGTATPNYLLKIMGPNVTSTANPAGSALGVFSSDAQGINLGGMLTLGGKNGAGGADDPYAFGTIAGRKENGTSSNYAGYLQFSTVASDSVISERMRISSTGLVTITGSAEGTSALTLTAGDINLTDGDLTLASGELSVDSDAGADTTAAKKALNVTATGTFNTSGGAITNYGAYVSNTSTRALGGPDLNNVGLYVTASGANVNYAAIFENGNVGIGDTTPDALLDIEAAAAFTHLTSTTGTNNVYMRITNTGGNTYLGNENSVGGTVTVGGLAYATVLQTDAARALQFGTSNTARMTIDAVGGFGFGTTTPMTAFTSNIHLSSTQPAFFLDDTDVADDSNGKLYRLVNDAGAFQIVESKKDGTVTASSDTYFSIASAGGVTWNSGLATSGGNRTMCGVSTTFVMSIENSSTCGVSSERFKQNIEDLSYGLDDVLALRPVSFQYKEDFDPEDRRTKIGFIAEEMLNIIPEVVTYQGDGQIKGIDYPFLTSVLARAIQELDQKVETNSDMLGSLSFDSEGNLIVPKVTTGQLVIDSSVLASAEDQYFDLSGKIASLEERLVELESNQEADVAGEATESAQVAEATPSADPSEEEDLELTPPDILIATGSAQLANLSVTSEATFSGKLASYDLTVSNSFKSLGTTTLGDTIVAGDFTVDGTLSLTGNSINSVDTLYIQNSPLASSIDLFNGKVAINSDGVISVMGISVSSSTIGEGIIPAGTTEVLIENTNVKESSKIFLTAVSDFEGNLIVAEKTEGSSFKVKLTQTPSSDVKFNWWIVQSN